MIREIIPFTINYRFTKSGDFSSGEADFLSSQGDLKRGKILVAVTRD